jgi:heme-degrading monooxygenase HmoA
MTSNLSTKQNDVNVLWRNDQFFRQFRRRKERKKERKKERTQVFASFAGEIFRH